MSRGNLRQTLGLAIFDHVPGQFQVPKVIRYLTRDILKRYGIRTNTKISTFDWEMAIKFAIEFRASTTSRAILYRTRRNPPKDRLDRINLAD